MWYLEKLSDSTIKHYILAGKAYQIGRKSSDADIVVPNDASVSRKHSVLNLEHSAESFKHLSSESYIVIKDASKYGTYLINNGKEEKINPNSTKHIKPGDVIRFGGQNSIYKVVHEPIIVTTSMISRDHKEQICKTVFELGGKYSSEWHQKINYVVMSSIKLSLKVTQALINGCDIVTPQYFTDLLNKIKSKTNPAPQLQNFLPSLDEPSLTVPATDFMPKPERAKLFSSKVFVFLNTLQKKKFESAIKAAGGKTCYLSQATQSDLYSTNSCVIDCGNQIDNEVATQEKIQKLKSSFAIKNLRLVAEHEIGLSVVYCCTDVYCNPSFELNSQNMFSQFAVNSSSMSMNSMERGKRTRSNNENEKIQDKRIKLDSCEITNVQKPSENIELRNEQSLDHEIESTITLNEPSATEVKLDAPLSIKAGENINPKIIQESCIEKEDLWSQNVLADSSSKTKSPQKKAQIPNIAKHEPVTPNAKMAFENKTVPVNNAFKSEVNDSVMEEPTAQMKVTFANLLCKKNEIQEEFNSSAVVKNFKRFKKVIPTYMRSNLNEKPGSLSEASENVYILPPKIIGGNDLVAYSKNNEESTNNGLMNWLDKSQSQPDTQSSQQFNPFL